MRDNSIFLIDLFFTFRNWRFPVELLTYFTPKLFGIVNAFIVHFIVLLHPSTVGLALNPLRRLIDIRHDSEMLLRFEFEDRNEIGLILSTCSNKFLITALLWLFCSTHQTSVVTKLLDFILFKSNICLISRQAVTALTHKCKYCPTALQSVENRNARSPHHITITGYLRAISAKNHFLATTAPHHTGQMIISDQSDFFRQPTTCVVGIQQTG